jgi:UDP-N-acetylmuramoylalanine--D-glutamate ligase
MAGIENHHALLDRRTDHGAVRADDAETTMKLEGTNVVVVGMARSGVAAARLLLEKGAHVRAVDNQVTGIPGLPVPIEPQTDAAFSDANLVVLSPGVPADAEVVSRARARGVRVIGDLELASWFLQGPIIGITGANGKTTTTALTGHILHASRIAAQVGGNIGTPPCAMIASSRTGQWNVLELSSFQLETVESFRANIAAVLNITPDHLDRHHTFENYAEAKARLFANQRPEDFAVLNADDPVTRGFAGRTAASVLWFSSTQKVGAGAYLLRGDPSTAAGHKIRLNAIVLDGEPLMSPAQVPLRGAHNLENTMAAAVIAKLAGATREQIHTAVTTFPGVEHRLEFIREVGGVSWYNDSKATNVDATLKAIDAFDGGLWVILGGRDKGSPYTPLAGPLAAKARGALLVGAAAEKIASELSGAVPLIHSETIGAAIEYARAHANPGDTVLLAPACSSYDQFENFEHRGREFKRLVGELGN